MISVGIDPGLDGAVAAIIFETLDNWQVNSVEFYSTPILVETKGKSKRRFYDEQGMARLIESLHRTITFGILEKAQPMPKQGVRSTFSIGEGYGIWKGILASQKISHRIIHPRTWQKKVCKDVPGDTKVKAILTAQRYFPTIDLTATERSKKPRTGRADALCMAIFGILDRLGQEW